MPRVLQVSELAPLSPFLLDTRNPAVYLRGTHHRLLGRNARAHCEQSGWFLIHQIPGT